MEHLDLGMAGLIGILGYLVVFGGLFLLMLVVVLLGKLVTFKRTPVSEARIPTNCAAPERIDLHGGEVELYNVNPRDAAVVMAIVADYTGKPLQELHFKSIKEAENNEVLCNLKKQDI